MADGKGGSFTKVVQKHAGRAKERILQNLGRADKTKDEVFEVYLYNFTRQQTAAAKLQKEFKNYVLCIKSLQLASKALMDTLSEIYEQEWVGHEQIPVKAQTLELLWDDYHRKMNDQVMIPLNSYINQFADVRGRIAKRGRKLVDYDKCRHSVESLRNSAKKKDDYKLGKAREELEEAKQMYEVINNELHEELPTLYESRIPFLVSNLQTFFTAESTFHVENSKVFSFLVDTMQKLATESEQQGRTLSKSPLSYGLPNVPRRRFSSSRADALAHNAIAGTTHYHNHTAAASLRRTHSDRERPRSLMASGVDGGPLASDTNERTSLRERFFNSRSAGQKEEQPLASHSPNQASRRFSSDNFHRQRVEDGPLVEQGDFTSRRREDDGPAVGQSGSSERSNIAAQYARVRRHSAHGAEPKRPASVDCGPALPKYYRRSVERGGIEGRLEAQRKHGGSFISLSAADSRGMGSRPVELYLVVRPPTGARPSQASQLPLVPRLETSSVSKEADTRPYEEIEFKKGKSNRASDISIKVTETNGQVTSPNPLMVSPVRSAARLENEDSTLVNTPGYRGSYTGDRNGEAPHHRRDEKDYEPVDVGAQMNSDGDKSGAAGDELYDIPVGATTTDLPAGVLYRVRATYKYTAEDVDELNFESGEIIRVIEYDDPEEQEEGWLMGIKESTGEKGLFPANFTRPI